MLSSAQSDRVDDCDVLLDVLCAFCRVLDVLEDLAIRRLSQDLANDRNGRGHILLYYAPWSLVLPSSIHRLHLIACFFEVCGVLDVSGPLFTCSHFGAITTI